MDVLAEIRGAIRRHNLIPPGETVVVGVSGGPDSLCLLHALLALRAEFDFDLHAAHLNHRLRGPESDTDAEFVGSIAARWGVPCTVDARDVAALARAEKLSLEEAARHARYAFLAEVAGWIGGHTIAVAHNADDQAETVLMHFLRGSGASGLRGMSPISNLLEASTIKLIRPMLNVPRAEVENYCRAHDLQPRIDRSNADTTLYRNRLRHELLPLLETYNPNVREVLRRTASVLAAEVDALHEATASAWRASIVSAADGALVFDLHAWRDLSLAMQRSTLREAIRRLRPALRNINFVHVDEAVSILREANTGTRLTLPHGLMLRVDYETFSLAAASREPALPDWPLLPEAMKPCLPIAAPGVVALPDSDWRLEASYLDAWGDEVFANLDLWAAHLDADAAGLDVSIRARRSGDVFHPQGMPSPAHLTDWMTNAKVPRAVRDRLPLVVAGDRIAWVAGFRIGQPFLVTPDTRRILQLAFRR